MIVEPEHHSLPIIYTASIKIRNCHPDFCYIRRESEIHKSFVKILC